MPDLSDLFGGVGFDPSTVDPQTDFAVIPPGKYSVLIERAEVKVTKKGTGHLISLEMKVLDGQFIGRKVFDNINIQNPSQQCVEIGMRTLSALGRALGLQTITDTSQLLNQVVVAHVKVKDEQNSVRTYSAAGGVAPATPAPVTPVVAPVTAPAAAPVGPAPVAAPVQQTFVANTAPAAHYPKPQQPTQPGKPPWQR